VSVWVCHACYTQVHVQPVDALVAEGQVANFRITASVSCCIEWLMY
jgi:hypothetical protein